MAQPIRRNAGAVRAYSDQLRVLMSHLAADPLDEQKSIALVSHIVERRGGTVVRVPIEPGHSTSAIIQKIRRLD